MVWIWFEYLPRVHVWKFNLYCEVVRGWKLNPNTLFRGKALRRWLVLNKVIIVDLCHWIPRAIRIERGKPEAMTLNCLHLLPCATLHCLGVLPARPDAATQLWFFQTMNQNKTLDNLFIFRYFGTATENGLMFSPKTSKTHTLFQLCYKVRKSQLL